MKKTWGDKRYHSLDYHLKDTFGRKLYKLSLNGGMTCPNRDGTLGSKGCIFCSSGGSGDFSTSPTLSITEQIEEAKKLVSNKLPKNTPQTIVKSTSYVNQTTPATIGLNSYENPLGSQYIAYFQAYTNTYGEISYLRKIFTEAILHPDIATLSIATRPDCIGEEVLELLTELNKIKPIWIELGLQTTHEKTALFIRRGYLNSCFEDTVKRLQERKITIIIHVILGLPSESKSDILETITYATSFPIQGIKLQLLHVLKDTDLADYAFPLLTMEEYIDLVISCLEIIPEDVIVHRITGDGPKKLLLGPLWSSNKKLVLNRINQELKRRDTWQGKLL